MVLSVVNAATLIADLSVGADVLAVINQSIAVVVNTVADLDATTTALTMSIAVGGKPVFGATKHPRSLAHACSDGARFPNMEALVNESIAIVVNAIALLDRWLGDLTVAPDSVSAHAYAFTTRGTARLGQVFVYLAIAVVVKTIANLWFGGGGDCVAHHTKLVGRTYELTDRGACAIGNSAWSTNIVVLVNLPIAVVVNAVAELLRDVRDDHIVRLSRRARAFCITMRHVGRLCSRCDAEGVLVAGISWRDMADGDLPVLADL
jgi:hypothetical protein